jgi:hypothetical protein
VLTLTVMAVDTNVEADRPGIGQNKETLIFKLVSDGELLTEISREEAGLADKLDDAIRRMADVDNKLRSMVTRFPLLTTPESFVPEQTRANELSEQMGKAKDVTAEVYTDYSRILLEFRANRLPDHLIRDIDVKIVGKLGEALSANFPQTEEAYGKLHGELSGARMPAAEVAFAAQSKVTELLNKLRDIRAGIGQGLDLKKLISQAEALIQGQALIAQGLLSIDKNRKEKLTWVTVTPPPAPVSVTAGQKVLVRIPAEIGQLYNGNFTLKLEASSGSELKVPTTITLKEDDKDFALEIVAGFSKGLHSIRVSPDAGPVTDVKVIVK